MCVHSHHSRRTNRLHLRSPLLSAHTLHGRIPVAPRHTTSSRRRALSRRPTPYCHRGVVLTKTRRTIGVGSLLGPWSKCQVILCSALGPEASDPAASHSMRPPSAYNPPSPARPGLLRGCAQGGCLGPWVLAYLGWDLPTYLGTQVGR